MKRKPIRALATALLAWSSSALSYDPPTHFDIADLAVERSVLTTDQSLLSRLGLNDAAKKFLSSTGGNLGLPEDCEHSRPFSPRKLIACGAEFEDYPAIRSLNHFFDPIRNEPLTVLVGGTWVDPGPALGWRTLTSPDWALDDPQDFSYKSARDYMARALITAGPQNARDDLWGLTFQSLGQVIHHLQDMAQPQHVRNDQHLSQTNPSHYERYTSDSRAAARDYMLDAASEPVYSPGVSSPFKVPRDFWINQAGTGIAQYTNTNYVSAGRFSIFQMYQGAVSAGARYAFPRPGAAEPVAINNLDVSQDIVNLCNTGLPCQMTFYSTTADIPRMAALSIFDQYVQLRPVPFETPTGSYLTDRVFAVNRFTFVQPHKRLLPRAVGYSAGLINYFFRGRMEISVPDEGVYGIVDHATPGGNDRTTGGFSTIKLKVKNVTPPFDQNNESLEGMTTTGTFWLVAKFHKNGCYIENLAGEYGAPGIDWHQCRLAEEAIVVSDPVTAPNGINASAQPVTFNFPNKIPISATDLYLQLVYRGPLGSESDAVVAETKDISEPTYLVNYTSIDQFTYDHWPSLNPGEFTYDTWCQQGGFDPASCNSSYGYTHKRQFSSSTAWLPNYDPNDPNAPVPPDTWADLGDERPMIPGPLVTMRAPVGQINRVAVLLDAPNSNKSLLVQEQTNLLSAISKFQWTSGVIPPAVAQLDSATNTLTPSVTYVCGRGLCLPSLWDGLLNAGSAPPLQLAPATIAF